MSGTELYPFYLGFEIHIQLSDKKLFCNCSSRWGNKDTGFRAKLNDIQYTYWLDHRMCKYERQQQLPVLNIYYLKLAKTVANRFNMQLLDSVKFERKYILDGSLVAGFQRSAIIANHGHINGYKLSELRLEEDSSKIVGNKQYHLCRQGVPLLQIVSHKILIQNEQQLEDIKKVLYTLTDIVRQYTTLRGIGSIRQDINVSKHIGKTQIKGFQQIEQLDKIVKLQIDRQTEINRDYSCSYETYNGLTSITIHNNALLKFIRAILNRDKLLLQTSELQYFNFVLDKIKNNQMDTTWHISKLNTLTYMRCLQDSSRFKPEYLLPRYSVKKLPFIKPVLLLTYKKLYNLNIQETKLKHLDELVSKFFLKYRLQDWQQQIFINKLLIKKDLSATIDELYPPFNTQMLKDIGTQIVSKPLKQIIYTLSNKYKKNIRNYAEFLDIVKNYFKTRGAIV